MNLPDDLTTRIEDVPRGALLVHNGIILRRGTHDHDEPRLCASQYGSAICWDSLEVGTPVLRLEGDEAVSLSRCWGRDVYLTDDSGGKVLDSGGKVLRWKHPGSWWESETKMFCDTTGSRIHTQVWPIARPTKEATVENKWAALHEGEEPVEGRWGVYHDDWEGPFCTGMGRADAEALAEHLAGWEPPEPPKRPSIQDLIDEFSNAHGDESGEIPSLTYLFEKHRYAVVDLVAIEEALGWLTRLANLGPRVLDEHDPAAAILDALGVAWRED